MFRVFIAVCILLYKTVLVSKETDVPACPEGKDLHPV